VTTGVSASIGAAGGAEGGELGVLEFQLLRLAEKLHVFGIGARPAAFDVVDTEGIEPLGDAQLVEAG
jgi:hypothetical protein